MKLVDDARDWWRWYSTWAIVALGAAPVIWAEMPPEVKALIPEDWTPYILAVVAIGGLVGRLKAQR